MIYKKNILKHNYIMNVVEAYIKFKGQLIIFVSGLAACGKTILAKNIATDFKLHYIQLGDYRNFNNKIKVKLPNGDEVYNWFNDDAYDWHKLNQDIIRLKHEGVIVSGNALPNDKVTIEPDYHIHLKISKQNCLQKRKLFLEKHKEKYPNKLKNFDSPKQKMIFNILEFPYHLDIVKRSRIHKFININDIDDDKVYDQTFDLIINSVIQPFLNNYNKKLVKQIPNEQVQIQKPQTRTRRRTQDKSQTLDIVASVVEPPTHTPPLPDYYDNNEENDENSDEDYDDEYSSSSPFDDIVPGEVTIY